MDCNQTIYYPLIIEGITVVMPLPCNEIQSTEWVGSLPLPDELNMTHHQASFYYGLLGIICAIAFIHHFRSGNV